MSSEPAEETKGPWKPDATCLGWRVLRPAEGYSQLYDELTDAMNRCDELNKLEAVREAAPELLAACKALMAAVHVAAKDNTNSIPADLAIAIRGINDAVRHAEPFPCSTKSSG